MSKTYFSTTLKPFWTIETQLPKDHVETIMSNAGYIWTKIKNNIEWNFPNQTMALISKEMSAPEYIKCSDGKNDFYFYKIGINNVEAQKDGEFFYRWAYKFDEYMSVYWSKLQLVLTANINVQFVRKFYDRFMYNIDPQTGYLLNGTIDFFKQIQYLKAPSDNVALVREFVYGSTAQLIYNKQNYQPLPATITFNAWDGTPHSVSIDPQLLAVPNINNRYLYLILKSSAKIDSVNTAGHADNNKIIVPLIAGQENVIIDRLFNFNATLKYPCILNSGGENVVGFYESQTPATLLVGANLSGEPVQLNCAFNGDNYTNPIGFFEVPHNYAFKFNLLNSDDAANGISAKLKSIIRNAVNTWDVSTEPMFLTDNFYREIHQIDTNNRLETAMSLITLTVDGGTFSQSGINISCYDFFDNNETMIYTYSLNNQDFGSATNKLNTNWNSNQSNRITSLSLSSGLYDSSSANYYASNSTTQFTSIQNRKSEEKQSWIDYGMDTAKSTISAASGFDILHPGKSIANVATTAISIAESATNNAMSNQRANLSLASSIQNIQSSPSSSVSSPYVSVCVPSTIEADGSYLFNTYAHRISDFDSQRIFIDLATNGYYTNETSPISKFENRIFYNVLHISTSVCFNILWKLLQDAPASIWNSQIYNSRFIEWLNRPHGIYRLNKIENYFDPNATDYKANIEITLPPLPDEKIDVNTLVDVIELGIFTNLSDNVSYYTNEQRWEAMMQNNIRILQAGLTYEDFRFIFILNTDGKESRVYAIVNDDNQKFYGVIGFYYTCPLLICENLVDNYFPNLVLYQNDSTQTMHIITNQTYNYIADMSILTIEFDIIMPNGETSILNHPKFNDDGTIDTTSAFASPSSLQLGSSIIIPKITFVDSLNLTQNLITDTMKKNCVTIIWSTNSKKYNAGFFVNQQDDPSMNCTNLFYNTAYISKQVFVLISYKDQLFNNSHTIATRNQYQAVHGIDQTHNTISTDYADILADYPQNLRTSLTLDLTNPDAYATARIFINANQAQDDGFFTHLMVNPTWTHDFDKETLFKFNHII